MKSRFISFLRWSEKYTKTDMVYLFHGGAWMLLSQGILFILSFFLLWVFANMLDREIYGQYRFLITVITILSFTSLTGMSVAIIRAVARGNGGIIHRATRTRLQYSLFGTIFALIGAIYYFHNDNQLFGQAFLIIAVTIPFFESFSLYTSLLLGKKEYKGFTITSIINKLFVVIITLVAILFSENLLIIFTAYVLSTSIISIILYYLIIRKNQFTNTTDTETIPYGKRLSLMGAIGVTSENLDKIALWYLMGPLEVAIYTVAISLPREIQNAFIQIGIIALPKMASRDKNMLQQSLIRKLVIFFIATIPTFFIYIFLAPHIFRIFLPQYTDSVFYSQVAGILILLAPATLLGQYFNATMNVKALYAQQFVLPITLIILFFIFIPIYGVLGAVLAILLKQIVSILLFFIYFLQDKKQLE